MQFQKIPTENGYYMFYEGGDFEYVNPVSHFLKTYYYTRYNLHLNFLEHKYDPIPPSMKEFLAQDSLKNATSEIAVKLRGEVPENFLSLLESRKKKDQIKLLKDATLTPDQLISFILQAGANFGYRYSQYRVEHLPGKLNDSDLPTVVEYKNNHIRKIGKTPLTDGQLRQVIEQRKVTISKFLDRGDTWHCFFITYSSLRGDESWKDGQAHFHYISDKFNLGRKKVVKELKSKYYNLGNLPHIDFLGYERERFRVYDDLIPSIPGAGTDQAGE